MDSQKKNSNKNKKIAAILLIAAILFFGIFLNILRGLGIKNMLPIQLIGGAIVIIIVIRLYYKGEEKLSEDLTADIGEDGSAIRLIYEVGKKSENSFTFLHNMYSIECSMYMESPEFLARVYCNDLGKFCFNDDESIEDEQDQTDGNECPNPNFEFEIDRDFYQSIYELLDEVRNDERIKALNLTDKQFNLLFYKLVADGLFFASLEDLDIVSYLHEGFPNGNIKEDYATMLGHLEYGDIEEEQVISLFYLYHTKGLLKNKNYLLAYVEFCELLSAQTDFDKSKMLGLDYCKAKIAEGYIYNPDELMLKSFTVKPLEANAITAHPIKAIINPQEKATKEKPIARKIRKT